MKWRAGLVFVALAGACRAEATGPELVVPCDVSPLRTPATGTPFELQVDSAATTWLADTSTLSATIAVRVARDQFFGAVPFSGALVEFLPRTPSTVVSRDSARTDSTGRVMTFVAYTGPRAPGDSVIVDVVAFANSTEVNRSPLAFAVCFQ